MNKAVAERGIGRIGTVAVGDTIADEKDRLILCKFYLFGHKKTPIIFILIVIGEYDKNVVNVCLLKMYNS